MLHGAGIFTYIYPKNTMEHLGILNPQKTSNLPPLSKQLIAPVTYGISLVVYRPYPQYGGSEGGGDHKYIYMGYIPEFNISAHWVDSSRPSTGALLDPQCRHRPRSPLCRCHTLEQVVPQLLS